MYCMSRMRFGQSEAAAAALTLARPSPPAPPLPLPYAPMCVFVCMCGWCTDWRYEVTQIFNEHGIQVSHSKVYQIQVQRDDLEAGRPNTRVIRPLPKQAQFHAVGKRGERYL